MAKRKHHAIEKVKSAKGSPGRGRLSVGERLVLEMLLAHVVHRLEGKGEPVGPGPEANFIFAAIS